MHPSLAKTIADVDPEIAELIAAEEQRQRDTIRLIASENYVSGAVLEATGTVLTNKYSEGYPGKRYYEGQQFIDQVETARASTAPRRCSASTTPTCSRTRARRRTSPSTSRSCKPGDTVMGMALPAGGHLTHGWNVSITGKYFRAGAVRRAQGRPAASTSTRSASSRARSSPKLLFCGGTAIPRTIDFAGVRRDRAARSARCSSPTSRTSPASSPAARTRRRCRHADVVSTTTHKTLRGPRGGMLMCKARARQGDRQGRVPRPAGRPAQPHHRRHRRRAARRRRPTRSRLRAPDRRERARRSPRRCVERGFDLVTGGTDNHLILVDLTQQGHRRQDRRQGARPRRHRAQLQHRARSTRASRSTRRASASARRRSRPAAWARPRCSRSPAWMDQVVSRAGATTALHARDRRRGARAVREVPGARHPGLSALASRSLRAAFEIRWKRDAMPLAAVSIATTLSRMRCATSAFDAGGTSITSSPSTSCTWFVSTAKPGVRLADVVRDDQVALLRRELLARVLDHVLGLGGEADEQRRACPCAACRARRAGRGSRRARSCVFAPSSPRLSFSFASFAGR